MPAITLPADLLALETRAWNDIQTGQLTADTAEAVHAAVVAFADAAGLERIDVETAVKQAVRHPETAG